MRRLRIRPRADSDIDEATDHYLSEAGITVATRFQDAIEQTWSVIREQPELGAAPEWLSSRLLGCRKWQVAKPFQIYQVFYCVSDDFLDVVRVLHGSRDIEAELSGPE